MKEILDFDPDERKEYKIETSAKIFTCSALLIMFFGGMLYVRYGINMGEHASFYQMILTSLAFMAFFIVLSTILDLLSRIIIRKNRSKIFSKLFIMKNVNFAFVIWLTFNLILLSDKYFS